MYDAIFNVRERERDIYIYIVNPAASHGFAHAFPESLLNISRTFLVLAPPKLK